MKLIIFAGGIGTRLWPLSRENSPKQFDKIFNNKSTIQLAVERLSLKFSLDDIYIQTNVKYKDIISKQVDIPLKNILIEPSRRDLGPAVCYSVLEMKKRKYDGPIALLWADHLMTRREEFIGALEIAKELILENLQRFVFLGERPRFANNNLGWIKIGKKLGEIQGRDYYKFLEWKYKPAVEDCDEMYRSGDYFWNPGYFISSVEFLEEQYRSICREIYDKVRDNDYESCPNLSFDEAIIERVNLSSAVVIKTNMGWSDPGTLYALKEALEKNSQDNVTHGLVKTLNVSDSLIYNLEKEKLLVAIGQKEMVIVNTDDALIVVPKDEVVRITDVIKEIKKEGLTQFL